MQPSALRRKGGRVGNLADEGMPEPVGVGRRVDDHQSGVDRRPERGFGRHLVEIDDASEQVRVRVPADSGQRSEHMAAGSVEPVDVSGEKIGQQGWDRLASEMSGSELFGEERVALATPKEVIDERWRRRDAEDRGGVLSHCAAIEAGQDESLDAAEPRQFSGTLAQRGIADDLVGPKRTDEHDPFVDDVADEVLEDVPRARIAPMQVVEPDDHRCDRSDLPDHLHKKREEITGTPRVRGRPLDEAGQ